MAQWKEEDEEEDAAAEEEEEEEETKVKNDDAGRVHRRNARRKGDRGLWGKRESVPKKRKVENGGGGLGREFWWRGSDLSDATAGSKLDILPPESALFSTNYFYLWLHDGYGHGHGGVGRGRQRTRKRRVNAINTSTLWMPAII